MTWHRSFPQALATVHATFAHVKEDVVCEERGEIHVKGIAYPVATYSVVGLSTDSAAAGSLVRANTPHLRLEIEPALMTSDERQHASTALRQALSVLETRTS